MTRRRHRSPMEKAKERQMAAGCIGGLPDEVADQLDPVVDALAAVRAWRDENGLAPVEGADATR